MLSSLEDKLAGAQGAYDSFVEARTVLGDSERTDENPGSKSAIISTKELQWLGLLESKNYIFVSLLDFKLSQWYSKNSFIPLRSTADVKAKMKVAMTKSLECSIWFAQCVDINIYIYSL